MRRLLCLLLFGLIIPAAAADRPNILWITVEDMSAALGCWGDSYASTPNIDKFASGSVRYTHAFATAPVCSPSRSCLITGLYAQSTGTHQMRSDLPLPARIKGWPSFLRAAGYFTANNVKTDYNTSSLDRLVSESWDDSSAVAHWRGRKDKSQPFFAVFNDMTTHQSRSMVWPAEKFQKEIQSQLSAGEIHDPALAPVPPYYPDTAVIRKTIARFYDCVSVMDKNTGTILQQLADDGLADDTIVFFFSDHGSGLPRHKRSLHDSGMHVPLLIHFPKKYSHLAPAAPGKSIGRLISFVDFPASVLSLLDIEIPDYMQGVPFLGKKSAPPRTFAYGARDRVDEVFDFARSLRTRDFLYIRNYRPQFGWNQRSVYSDQSEIRHEFYKLTPDNSTPAQWAYAAPSRPEEELYDLRTDPYQIRNIASTQPEILKQMRADQMKTARDIRDLGYVSETKLTELSENTTPFDWAIANPAEIQFDNPPALETATDLTSDSPIEVLVAIRQMQLQGAAPIDAVRATYEKWKDRKDTSLALFIRFSCEAILGIKGTY